ncbi:hypothetical protein [Halosimplex sp. J119]
MSENDPAVDEILTNIPLDGLPGPNKIRDYNAVFRTARDHGYEEEVDRLVKWAIEEVQEDEYNHLPGVGELCRQLGVLSGVDEDLESDLPRNF